jgi:hypothetical protein
VICLLGALALAGCGVTVNFDGDNGGVQRNPTPGGSGGGTASVKPCPGDSVTSAPSPTIILTVENSYKTTAAHVGDTIEVQLDAKTHWSSPENKGASALTAIDPQGGLDETTQTCRWFFTAAVPGTAILDFTGAPLCDPNAPCPALARAEQFTIEVS